MPPCCVEQHIARLRENLIPLAERCGRVMREAIAALEVLRAAPSQAVERSRPARITVMFEAPQGGDICPPARPGSWHRRLRGGSRFHAMGWTPPRRYLCDQGGGVKTATEGGVRG